MNKVAFSERPIFSHQLQLALKRTFDFLAALGALIFFSPFILVVAIATYFDSGAPVIYSQKRVGKDGKEFFLYKFRSMRSGADDGKYKQYLKELIESERNGKSTGKPYRKMENDPRVTRVGSIIRRYYLDEIPQFVNVLKGDMSIVGPRPHVQMEVDAYSQDQMRRLSVKPGLTGLWQVKGKADCTFSQLIEMDLDYIDNWTFWMDIKTIWDTMMVMVRGGEHYYAPSGRTRSPSVMALIPSTGTQEKASVLHHNNPLEKTANTDAATISAAD